MKNILFVLCTIVGSFLYAQEQIVEDQNPNHQKAYEKYAAVSNQYTIKQGTTSDETYVAIDPMREKRIRKNRHKEYRSMKPLWRHQERMERAKNTRYYQGHRPQFSFWNGLGLGFGYRSFNNRCSFLIR